MSEERFDSWEPQRILLIIDKDDAFGRALERALKRHFDHIYVATTSAYAFGVLSDIPVTHLIANHDLGIPRFSGINVILYWRNERPKIEKAILLAGGELPKIDEYEEIDAVLPKNTSIEELVKALGIWKAEDSE